MQDGPAIVQRDDGVVRQLLFAQSARLQKRELDFEFRGALGERLRRSDVPARSQLARLTHARQFVGRLRGASVVEMAHESWGIDRSHRPLRERWKRIAD